MRNPKGKLVALLAGAVAVLLLTLAVLFWKDIYCHALLDPRLVGQWKGQFSYLSSQPPTSYAFQDVMTFDRVGNVRSTTSSWATSPPSTRPEGIVSLGTYRIDGNSLSIVWPHRVWSAVYRVEEDTLTLPGSSGRDTTYRRVPDDS